MEELKDLATQRPSANLRAGSAFWESGTPMSLWGPLARGVAFVLRGAVRGGVDAVCHILFDNRVPITAARTFSVVRVTQVTHHILNIDAAV